MNHFLEMELLKEKINIPKKTLNDFSYVFNEIFKQSEKRVAYKNIKLLYVKLRLFFLGISKGSLKVRDILFAYEFISGLKSSFPNVDLDACLSTIDSLFFMNVECKKINNITKDIHFIWLGEIKKENMEFMKIWKDFNPEFKVHLWTDKKSIPSPIFFIKSNLKHSLNHQLFFFAHKEICFFYMPAIFIKPFPHKQKKKPNYIGFFRPLSAHTSLYDDLEGLVENSYFELHDVSEIFKHCIAMNFIDIYLFEMFIRSNLAAASDIMRMLILYCKGGVYLDMDTLPDMLHYDKSLIEEMIEAIPNSDFTKREMLDVGITNESLSLMKECGYFKSIDFFDHNYYLFKNIKPFFILGEKISCYPFFYKLDEVIVSNGDFIISKDKYRENVFFSNFIVSSAGNNFTKISLSILRDNYNSIGVNEAINKGYISREKVNDFIEYFFDGVKNDSMKTLYISGPGVLIKASILAIIKEFYLPMDIDKKTLIHFLWKVWSSEKHSINNAIGCKSTWRK